MITENRYVREEFGMWWGEMTEGIAVRWMKMGAIELQKIIYRERKRIFWVLWMYTRDKKEKKKVGGERLGDTAGGRRTPKTRPRTTKEGHSTFKLRPSHHISRYCCRHPIHIIVSLLGQPGYFPAYKYT